MWTAEKTAGSKDLRSVYGPLPGPDRPQICGVTEDRRHHQLQLELLKNTRQKTENFY